ncbi:MAG: ABC transporter ATP-binding protein [Planctomycetota bacterium]
MDALIELNAVTKWYGPVIAVNDVTLEFARGVTGLLGPNGAGKSTLLKLITGQVEPSKGEVRVFGQPAFGNHRLYTRLGYAPEHEELYDHLSGFEFLRALGHLSGLAMARAADRSRALLAVVRLADAGDRRVGTYSKGMRQRLRLAQALIHDPDVLILDEPLTGLDPVGRRETIELIKELGRAGKCVLVSSHVLYEVEYMTRHIALMAHGRVLAEGRIEEIRDLIDRHPHHVSIRTGKPRDLARHLLELPGVVSVRLGDADDQLTIETRQPDLFYSALLDVAVGNDVAIDRLHSPDDNLQAVFDYLVR